MPVIGTFHTFYWENTDTSLSAVVRYQQGYPLWQSSVIAPSLFGVIGARWDAFREQWRWLWRVGRRLARLPPTSQQVTLRVLDVLESPVYQAARKAVAETAQTLGFNRPEMWIQYSRAIKAEPGRAENIFRHLRACERTEQIAGSTLTNPELNLVTELAYQAYAIRPWRS